MIFKKKKSARENIGERIEKYLKDSLKARFPPFQTGIKSIEKIGRGENTILRVISSETGQRFVARFYPYEPHKEKALEHCYVSTLFKRNNLNTPKIFFKDTSPETREDFGFDVVIEAFIQGTPLNTERLNEKPDLLRNFIAQLQTLHSVTSKSAGKFWRVENEREAPLTYFLQRTRLYLTRINKYLTPLNTKEQKYYLNAMVRLSEPLKSITTYNLIHGDLQPHNILVTPNGDIYFLDFGRTCYGFFEEDLVEVFYGIYTGARDGFNLFLTEYFSQDKENRHSRFEKNFSFFTAFYHLEKASSSAVKVRKIQEGRRKSDQPDAETKLLRSKAERCWERFLLVMQQVNI